MEKELDQTTLVMALRKWEFVLLSHHVRKHRLLFVD